MADVKWIKIPSNFFELDVIQEIDKSPHRDETLLILIQLITISNKKFPRNKFQISKGFNLSDEVICSVLKIEPESWLTAKNILMDLEIIKIIGDTLFIKDFWKTSRDRNSKEYTEWRLNVFKRDKYTCQHCHKTGGELEAHHKIRWVDDISKRYEVDNGITLCKKCHKETHKETHKKEGDDLSQKEECLQKQ